MREIKNKAELYQALPHGSGIDSDWYIETTSRSYRAYNSYHCMDQNGFYDGWADFKVIIPFDDYARLKVQFKSDGFTQYRARKYMLREYLADVILYALEVNFPRRVADLSDKYIISSNSQDVKAWLEQLGIEGEDYPTLFIEKDVEYPRIYAIEADIPYLDCLLIRLA